MGSKDPAEPSESVNQDKSPILLLFPLICLLSPATLLFSYSPFIFLTPLPLFLFKTLSSYIHQSVLLPVSWLIHSSLSSLRRTVLGCVFGRGSGSSWLISVCSTTKVKRFFCVMSTGPSTQAKCLILTLPACFASFLFVFSSPLQFRQERNNRNTSQYTAVPQR